MKLFMSLVVLFALTVSAAAADITGTWKAKIETPNGSFTSTFVFKVDGDKLTGTANTGMGELAISEGKIDGDNLSFAVIQKTPEHDYKMTYTGKINGDEIKLTLKFPLGSKTIDMIAKKVS